MNVKKAQYKAMTGLKVSAHNRVLVLAGDDDISYPIKHLYLYICEVASWGKAVFSKDRNTIQK